MKYEETVLVGGPNDGQRINVLEGIPHVLVLPRQVATVRPHFAHKPSTEVHESAEYHRVSVASDKGFLGAVYVYGDIDALVALLIGYRKP